jgi:hypothetical protein
MPPVASALKSLVFRRQNSARSVWSLSWSCSSHQSSFVMPMYPGRSGRATSQRADQLAGARLQPGESPPILPLEESTVAGPLAIAVPVAAAAEHTQLDAVLPDQLVPFPLRVRLRRRIRERQLLVLLDVRGPGRTCEVRRTGDGAQLARPLHEVQLRMERRSGDGTVRDDRTSIPASSSCSTASGSLIPKPRPDDRTAAPRWLQLEQLRRARRLRVGRCEVETAGAAEGLAHAVLQRDLLVQPRLVPHRLPTSLTKARRAGHRKLEAQHYARGRRGGPRGGAVLGNDERVRRAHEAEPDRGAAPRRSSITTAGSHRRARSAPGGTR